jgi:hypothetical protein
LLGVSTNGAVGDRTFDYFLEGGELVASTRTVNYSVRVGKHVERQMII